jgi:hypothetical protein
VPASRSRARACLRLVALLPALATGCTMCPNQFDYAGPVPNGSATQNDFRARSNGIIPIGLFPRPWPALVKRADEPGGTLAAVPRGEPTLAAPEVDAAADGSGVVPVVAESDVAARR